MTVSAWTTESFLRPSLIPIGVTSMFHRQIFREYQGWWHLDIHLLVSLFGPGLNDSGTKQSGIHKNWPQALCGFCVLALLMGCELCLSEHWIVLLLVSLHLLPSRFFFSEWCSGITFSRNPFCSPRKGECSLIGDLHCCEKSSRKKPLRLSGARRHLPMNPPGSLRAAEVSGSLISLCPQHLALGKTQS